MNTDHIEWEARLSELWSRLEEYSGIEFVDAMRNLIDERNPADAVAFFELGAANDSTGRPREAIELYCLALAGGLSGIRRRRARIQMASSLRNVGKPQEAAEILFAEMNQPPDELNQAVSAFLALTLADLGREREALSLSLSALSTYLPRYNGSLARYAAALTAAA